ncbi:hypothetical protein ACNKHL_17695 [Shigella flexneri]
MLMIGAYHADYHTTQDVYEHRMGVKPGGNITLLACAGPMATALSITPLMAAQTRRGWWWSIDDNVGKVQKLLPVDWRPVKALSWCM